MENADNMHVFALVLSDPSTPGRDWVTLYGSRLLARKAAFDYVSAGVKCRKSGANSRVMVYGSPDYYQIESSSLSFDRMGHRKSVVAVTVMAMPVCTGE